MSRKQSCKACQAIKHGIKSRRPWPHTCGKQSYIEQYESILPHAVCKPLPLPSFAKNVPCAVSNAAPIILKVTGKALEKLKEFGEDIAAFWEFCGHHQFKRRYLPGGIIEIYDIAEPGDMDSFEIKNPNI